MLFIDFSLYLGECNTGEILGRGMFDCPCHTQPEHSTHITIVHRCVCVARKSERSNNFPIISCSTFPGHSKPPMYTELHHANTLSLFFNSLQEEQAGKYTCKATYANSVFLEKSVTIDTIGKREFLRSSHALSHFHCAFVTNLWG